MKAVLLKIPEELFDEAKSCAAALDLSNSEYIRHSLMEMNRQIRRRRRSIRMAEASLKVRGESMKVNAEFAAIEGDPDAEEK
jgi:phosphomevalonate kinase